MGANPGQSCTAGFSGFELRQPQAPCSIPGLSAHLQLCSVPPGSQCCRGCVIPTPLLCLSFPTSYSIREASCVSLLCFWKRGLEAPLELLASLTPS